MVANIIDLHRKKVSPAVETELIKAESDMVVRLEQAHRAAPELSLRLLTMTSYVIEYKNQVLQDVQDLTGVSCRMAVQAPGDRKGDPCYIVTIILDGDPK